MKNIHVLPTENSSRLIIYSTLLNEFRLLDAPIDDWKHKRNIYITSDEEIKRYGEYYLDIDTNEVKTSFENMGKYLSNEKKIVLTTDQDLIKDGVQAIDDEFLEWFVKNPSCYEVEVLFACRGLDGNTPIGEYRIIIPQEEFLKQERMSGSKTVSKILDGGKPNKFLIDEIGQFNFTKNKLYNQEEVGELVYKIIGEYGNHYGIMIDGEMINELFEKFKKK